MRPESKIVRRIAVFAIHTCFGICFECGHLFGNIGKVLFYWVIIIRQFKNGILCVVFNFFKSLMLFVYRGKTQNKYNQ